jgi:RNA polymerase sigma-70 factor (ECF subfamily)
MNDQITDEQLMQRYLEGDARAFEELMRRHGRKLYNFILRKVHGDADKAADILQDSFFRVVHKADSFQQHSRFTTWLYTIARNLCIDAARKASYRQHARLDAPLNKDDDTGATLGDKVADERPGQDSEVRDKRFREELVLALEKLPEEQREVFEMREFQGLKFREIADILDIPENTVKSRMRYALGGLRVSLSKFSETI